MDLYAYIIPLYSLFVTAFSATIGIIVDYDEFKVIFEKPSRILISLFCNQVFLPLLGYGLSWALFQNESEVQIGVFFIATTAFAPISICWTLLLKGNVDLSIAISVTNVLLSCWLVPFWAIVLGRTICNSDDGFDFPFLFLLIDNFLMAISFCVGLMIGRFVPGSKGCPKLLAIAYSIIYLSVVFVLGVWQSFDIFMFLPFDLKWRILAAGFLILVLGYLVAWIISTLFKLELNDRLTIAIGTFGYSLSAAIFMYRDMVHPQFDLIVLVHTCVVVMIPFPLGVHYFEILLRKQIERFLKACVNY